MMENMQIPFLFSFHIILFGAKVWFVWVMLSRFKITRSVDANLNMIIFSKRDALLIAFTAFIIMSEMWFIASFYTEVDLFAYNYLAILDQVILSTLLALSYKGGQKNG